MKSSNPAPPNSTGLRRFLYLTAAVTGACILIVEILGAKMLSPFLGSSHFVWTAQIAVTLASLAVGYYFGGWLVDRSARLERLYNCIAVAALYLAVTVFTVEKVAYACLEANLALASLLASSFLFFVPLTLLAATGPFLIRVMTQTVDQVGGQVGRLSAISTFGSVLGTVLIGYAILPYLANSTTMFITAGILLLVVILFHVIFAKNKSLLLVWLLCALIPALGFIIRDKLDPKLQMMNRLYSGNSNFGQIQVLKRKEGSQQYYLNDYLIQNTYDTEAKASMSLFTYMLHELAWGYARPLESALCIGMGIGIVPNALNKEGVKTDVVEINPAIVSVAKEFFDFNQNGMNLTIGDGRFFINKSQQHYDAILLDAFLGDSSPSHLMTREAFAEMARLLGTNGVLVINSFGEFRPGRDFFVASLDKTLRAVFKNVQIHASGNGNVFFAASHGSLELKLRPAPKFPISAPGLESDFSAAMELAPRPDPSSGIILTDDFNPVEFHDAANRERHRRAMAMSIRRL